MVEEDKNGCEALGCQVLVVMFVLFLLHSVITDWENAKSTWKSFISERQSKAAIRQFHDYKSGDKSPPGWRKGEWELYKAEHPEKVDDYLWGQVLD